MFLQWILRLFIFILYGIIWLFLFSIPLDGKTKLFHVGYYYIVDTRPMHFLLKFVKSGADRTTETASDTAIEIIRKAEEKAEEKTEVMQEE